MKGIQGGFDANVEVVKKNVYRQGVRFRALVQRAIGSFRRSANCESYFDVDRQECTIFTSLSDKERQPRYTDLAHGSSEVTRLTTRQIGAIENWVHGSYLEFTYESRQMRFDYLRMTLMLFCPLVASGCSSQSPVNPSPITNPTQAASGSSRGSGSSRAAILRN